MNVMTRIYIIAGEPSGDSLGASLIESLLSLAPKTEIVGVGGKKMHAAGLRSLFAIDEISMMGFFEILPHIFKLRELIDKTAADVVAKQPDILVTIDSPGFTYRVAKKVQKLKTGIKMVHLVAPSVWAYRPGRAVKYAKVYDHLLTLLPFEPKYFEKVGLPATFIGHPVLDQNFYQDKREAREELGLKEKQQVVCVTPGSRKGEIVRHMPIFKEALDLLATKVGDIEALFVLANLKDEALVKSFLAGAKFSYRLSHDHLASFAAADVALAKSGTNTLEITASGAPMVVAYRLSTLSYLLIRSIIKVGHASLVNIIAKEEIIPELIQFDATAENIAEELLLLLSMPEAREFQVREAGKILARLKNPTGEAASLKAAHIILQQIDR